MPTFLVAAHDNHTKLYPDRTDGGIHPTTVGLRRSGELSLSRLTSLHPATCSTSGVYTDGATRYNIQNLAVRLVRPRLTVAAT